MRRPWSAWVRLAVPSLSLAAAFDLASLPAAWLLVPMTVAVAASIGGLEARVPDAASTVAQALVGCLIAHAITPSIVAALADRWALFLATAIGTIAASGGIGYLLARWRVVPGSVAIWGSSPGGATAMVVLAQAWGADARLVAIMVYLRVLMVAALASAMTLVLTGGVARPPAIDASIVRIGPAQLGLTLAVAAAGVLLGRSARLPAGALIGAMALGAVLNLAGVARVAPPRLLMLPAYVAIGWRVGLGFTRETLRASARALPRLALATAVLLAFCGALAWLLVRFAGVDPLTAYLATSPGGMDVVAVIASTSAADAPFVMALQVIRFLLVMALGPALATRLAARAARAS